MRVRKQEDIAKIYLLPGDTIHLSYTDADGEKTELIQDQVNETLTVDRVVIVDFENEFGFKRGLGALMGEK